MRSRNSWETNAHCSTISNYITVTTHTSNRTITLNPVMVRRSGIHLLLLFMAGLLQARAADDAAKAGVAIPMPQQFTAAPQPAGDDSPKADPAAVAKWQAMRFGMFIHWGPVSLTGHEIGWSRGNPTPIEEYDNLYKQFNPTNFNADEWVSIAKAAGMKYIVLTTKHMDGFCLWDTKLTDYNIMNTPFKRDVVKELAAACKQQGIEFGAYYCVPDWYNKYWPTTREQGQWGHANVNRENYDLDAYEKYLQGQITELIKNYGPLLTIWNDAGHPNDLTAYGDKRGRATIKLVRSLQPDILINNRTGAGGDYGTPEQHIGGFDMDHPWESCMTVSGHDQWAWGGPGDGVKSTATCLKMLISAAGGDGNVLLNVGPRPDGMIDPAQANLLKEVGAWLAKYGESIYGTRGGPVKPGQWGVSTRKGNRIYLHVFKFDGDTLTLPAIPAKITAARVLTGGSVAFKQTDLGITLTVPVASHDEVDTLIALDMDQPAMGIAPLNVPSGSIAFGAGATASNIYGNQASEYGPQAAFDDDSGTRWATDGGTKQCWIAADLGKPQVVQSIRIKESFGPRVQKFEFQYRAGDEWKTIFTGTTIGGQFEKSFPAVTAEEFRLNILDATDGPTISEIELGEK